MADLLKNVQAEVPPARVEVPPQEEGVENEGATVERAPETTSERAPEKEPVSTLEKQPSPTAASVAPVKAVPVQKDAVTIHVEQILEEGLGSMYATLKPEEKALFRERGESVAKEVSEMVRTFRVKVANVLRLIRGWLHTIPGVNKFFLEQEAKLKTDRIVELTKAREEDLSKHP